MDQQCIYSKPNYWMVSTLVLVGIIIGFGIAQIPAVENLIVKDQGSAAVLKPEAQAEEEEKETILSEEQIKTLPDDDIVIGDANAPVTMIEFSDFQCPYCSRFAQMSLPQIEEQYIKTGKVKFVFRDFPLDGHLQALPAALASECADEQGKFKEMHDILYAEQSAWSGDAKAVDIFKKYAAKIGLKAKQFNSCLDDKKFADEVRKDLVDGASLGVNGTPAFFINGKLLSGAMPFDLVFKPIFDAVLDGKDWEIQFDPNGRPSVNVE